MQIKLSLKALEAFESASRTGSFVAAAQELSISPAAVSQLIRNLEHQLEVKLFHRLNRRITLTEAGLEIQPHVRLAFEELNLVAHKLTSKQPHRKLVISMPVSVAVDWLSMRISGFTAIHGHTDFALVGEEDPVSFEKESVDIRMTNGEFFYHDHDTQAIMTDVVFPACSPEFLIRHGPIKQPAQLLELPLIHTDWGPSAAAFPSWGDWFEYCGIVANRLSDTGLTANFSRTAIDLARGGLGVVLCQQMLASSYLNDGSLVRLGDQALPLSQPYCLTIPQNRQNRQIVVDFKRWLTDQMLETGSATARLQR